MKKRTGETLVEVLIALLIIIIAVSISVVASSTIVNLKTKAKIKTDIYDIAYSKAEEQLSTSVIIPESTMTKNGIIYTIETTYTTLNTFFGNSSTVATLYIYPYDYESDYKIEMTLFPKQ